MFYCANCGIALEESQQEVGTCVSCQREEVDGCTCQSVACTHCLLESGRCNEEESEEYWDTERYFWYR